MKKIPSKDNNQFKVDYDFPGLCCLCHCEIAEFNGSHPNGRPKIKSLKSNFHTAFVTVNDGSKMKVSLCMDCFFDLKPEDMKAMMESVINGWGAEVERLDNWNIEKKTAYMDEYSGKFITNREDFPYSDDQIVKIKRPDKKKLNYKSLKGA